MKSILICSFLALVTICCKAPVQLVVNPYENINWKTIQKYKANFHLHTTNSDGSLTADYAVDTYAQHNYKIIMITDHDVLTWPWTNFSDIKSNWKNRNPDSMHVLTFPAIELDEPHHRGMFFARVHGGCYDLDSTFQQGHDSSALVIMNHPGRYWKLKKKYSPGEKFSPEWYIGYLNKYPEIVGLEVYNRPTDVNLFDRILWDIILTKTMPGRPVWGFANDDMHVQKQMMGNYQFMLMEELSVPALKTAMKNGHLFASNEPEHSGAAMAPEIDSIQVDGLLSEIRVYARNYDSIRWFSGVDGLDKNRKSHLETEGAVFHFENFNKPYVRFELKNEKGTTLSQPFGFSN